MAVLDVVSAGNAVIAALVWVLVAIPTIHLCRRIKN